LGIGLVQQRASTSAPAGYPGPTSALILAPQVAHPWPPVDPARAAQAAHLRFPAPRPFDPSATPPLDENGATGDASDSRFPPQVGASRGARALVELDLARAAAGRDNDASSSDLDDDVEASGASAAAHGVAQRVFERSDTSLVQQSGLALPFGAPPPPRRDGASAFPVSLRAMGDRDRAEGGGKGEEGRGLHLPGRFPGASAPPAGPGQATPSHGGAPTPGYGQQRDQTGGDGGGGTAFGGMQSMSLPKGAAPNRAATAAAGAIGLDVDDRRGEVDERGRPWYDMQYHDFSTTFLGRMRQELVQKPYALLVVVLPHYLLAVPLKIVALLLFYGLCPPHLLLLAYARAKWARGQRTPIATGYIFCWGLLLMLPWLVWTFFLVAPFTFFLCRHEAGTECFYAWAVLPLHPTDGWTIPSQQMTLTNERINPRLMPIRVWSHQRGVVARREWVETEKVLPGLAKFNDVLVVDKNINKLILRGHLMSAKGFLGFNDKEWAIIAERFVGFCIKRKRARWGNRPRENWLVFVVNSAACTLSSARFASRFHPLTRNERSLALIARFSLNICFAAVLFGIANTGSSRDPFFLKIIFGLASFVLVQVLTLIAGGTCLTGRGIAAEVVQEIVSKTILVIAATGCVIAAVWKNVEVWRDLTAREARGALVFCTNKDEGCSLDRQEYIIDLIVAIATSEISAWIFGSLAFFTARAKERKTVTKAGYDYDNLLEITRYYVSEFCQDKRWPDHVLNPPSATYRDQFVLDMADELMKPLDEGDNDGDGHTMEVSDRQRRRAARRARRRRG